MTNTERLNTLGEDIILPHDSFLTIKSELYACRAFLNKLIGQDNLEHAVISEVIDSLERVDSILNSA